MAKKSSIEIPELNQAFIKEMLGGNSLVKSKNGKIHIRFESEEKEEEKPTLAKSIINMLNGQGSIERLAFETDPSYSNNQSSLYKTKLKLIPDTLLKRMAIQSDLVAAIIQARQNHLSTFGRPRPDRWSMGFVIEPRQEINERIESEPDENRKKQAKEELRKKIAKTVQKLYSCGSTKGYKKDDLLTFPQYLSQSVRNALVVGRIATEMISYQDKGTNEKKFHSFRPIDAGTIYKASPYKQAAEAVRKQARDLLEQYKNKKLIPEKFKNEEYSWIQVINEKPVQAFTDEECLVHNFYQVPDVELDGYPVTPLDTIISAVTTNLNITTHNKLYFQNGRAARGMLVIHSDDVDESVVARIRQQFNASINSSSNSWRMPVFAVPQGDDITWQSIDTSGRDMEFQYLSDMNARIILSAFQMSPDELTGWSYLSRGTNSQALSEGNNEYKLLAARDTGLKPLLAQFENFVNASIFPVLDLELSEICVIKFVGVEAESAEKESVRLAQDQPIHMTYDEVLQRVEKRSVGKNWGGEFPFNPAFQAILDKYLTVGQILEKFFGIEGASKDPQWAYCRDQFWFSWMQMQQQAQAQQQQMQMQAQQQPQQQQGEQPQGQPEGQQQTQEQQPEGSQQQEAKTENQKNQQAEEASASPQDLTRSIDQALSLLSKAEGESNLPASKKALLAHQKAFVINAMRNWESDLREINKEILSVAKQQNKK